MDYAGRAHFNFPVDDISCAVYSTVYIIKSIIMYTMHAPYF